MHRFPAEARQGRSKQLYDENNARQVSAAMPIDPETKRILLVSSSKHPGAWVFPKGGWENDESSEQAAERETYEEAGVLGTVTKLVGNYLDYDKNGIPRTRFWVYEMQIHEILDSWPESKIRQRRWFTYDEAMIAVARKPFMQQALRSCTLAP